MTIEQLGSKLQTIYNVAKKRQNGEVGVSVARFGIEHAKHIDLGIRGIIPDIVECTNLPEDYTNELRIGVKLAKYVTSKSA